MQSQWREYKRALLPNTPPHVNPELDNINKMLSESKALFARYTTDFDCGYLTEWWYCIKDDKMDLNSLNAKRRYEVNKGLKNVQVKQINQVEYLEEIYDVFIQSIEEYPKHYKPKAIKENFVSDILSSTKTPNIVYYGCFLKNTMEFCGYAKCVQHEEFVNLLIVKVKPSCLSKGVNAALVYTICCDYLNNSYVRYIVDGERNIIHKTRFQKYLVKYFGFRFAYCRLNIIYKPITKIAVNVLFPFRNLIKVLNKFSVINNLTALLELERIRRSFLEWDVNKEKCPNIASSITKCSSE